MSNNEHFGGFRVHLTYIFSVLTHFSRWGDGYQNCLTLVTRKIPTGNSGYCRGCRPCEYWQQYYPDNCLSSSLRGAPSEEHIKLESIGRRSFLWSCVSMRGPPRRLLLTPSFPLQPPCEKSLLGWEGLLSLVGLVKGIEVWFSPPVLYTLNYLSSECPFSLLLGSTLCPPLLGSAPKKMGMFTAEISIILGSIVGLPRSILQFSSFKNRATIFIAIWLSLIP